ncbi:ubiquitin carboxyl-terminal hydrolase 38 isoform X2 [Wyeomyia smithii]|nr:ubiquitin carboxyl-terminal hydrolase 38 isoform X2 [Wyeomyia smithii]XP_055540359.1 ubiquitin carboxyl-terminal hydrolase 38 isoform X2 [Wyeomyia smithii]XP_055540360.1 ubiquitin carboxyl-terminal hydrolase 38 isoform X2 [Wyeomyia smithii]XP_055540361.1 ubiquitin carboxyl-terminal hydrolase 38 isoform X2 [Wyeomyia smithii]XP_055540362.1 ubiquitin carboxyl-terminal hydrolase 38 isoform X2 [Wyeomyia smithii]
MAVKQHVTDLVQNQPKPNIANMIAIIEMLQANPETLTNEDGLIKICEQLVYQLAHTPASREAAEIKTMKLEIGKVCHFFRELIERVPQQHSQIRQACLTVLYNQIIALGKETSNYASAVLVLVDKSMINNGVTLILQQSNSDIKKIFKTLSHWLETYDFAPDLAVWVLEILIRLRKQQKQALVQELSLDIIDSYFGKLIFPTYRSKLGSVVMYILQSNVNTPDILHKITPKVSKVLKTLSKDATMSTNSPNLFQFLVDILSALMLQNSTMGNEGYRNEELDICLERYSKSKNFRQLLDNPLWHDTSHSIMVASTNARVGLVNLGNTCYMNSVLQALVMTKQFSREVLLSKIDAPLFLQIQKLLALLLHSVRPELTPRALLAAARPPDFVPGYQQDSSEFLGYLLEKLHEQEKKLIKDQFESNFKGHWTLGDKNSQMQESFSSVNGITHNELRNNESQLGQQESVAQCSQTLLPPTLIQKTFDGKLFVTYQCNECGSQSSNLDAFRSFELSFPESSDLGIEYSVQKLLDFYCSSEKLIGDNQYFCDKCKRLCNGERSIRILKSPRNLILTLKHFRYDQQRHTRAKLMNKVLHDEIISLRIVTETGHSSVMQYVLYAAVVHAGTSMDSGHYYTYAQDKSDCWYKFNDNFVTKCSADELHSLSSPNTPYILFYQMQYLATVADGTNDHCIDLDEDMDDPSVVKSSASSSKSIEDCQLPELEELPSHLRDIIVGDNQSYKEEMRNENRKITKHRIGTNKIVLPKNYDSDNEDPPPNSCGSKIDYNNRFIF